MTTTNPLNMENLIQQQEVVGQTIVQLETNYKKDGNARKTKTYLETKIAKLKVLYTEYVTNDDAIRKMEPQLEQPEYLQAREKIREIYDLLIDDMRKRLNNGPPNTPTSSNTFTFSEEDSTKTKTVENRTSSSYTNNNEETSDRKDFNKMMKTQDVKMRMLYSKIRTAQEALTQNKSKQTLKLVLKQIEKIMDQIMDLNEKISIEASIEDEENLKYFTEQYYNNIEQEYDDIVVKLTTQLENENEMNNDTSHIRLPNIEIPHFYGDNMKWKGFSGTFEKLVHNNKTLTETHKINYLKSHLGGPAAKIISHLETTAENYGKAWDILNNRYNNERVLAAAYFNQVINQPNITTETAAGIRAIHDTTREAIHNINNILIGEEKFDALIIHILQKKLDAETIRLYETTLDDPKRNQKLNHFLSFLEKRFQSLEAIGNKYNRHPTTSGKLQQQKVMTTLTDIMERCTNCKEPHSIETCKSFLQMSTMDRNKLCTAKNLCRWCLGNHKYPNQCWSKNSCLVCKGNHHTLLHTKEGITKKNKLPISNEVRYPATRSVNPIVETHMLNNATTTAQVILSTALVKVPTNGSHPELLRVLVDPGSQASFITTDAAKKLNIQGQKTRVEFKGIGGMKAGVSNRQIKFHIHPRFSSKFKLPITALIVDQLVGNLPEYGFNAWNWPHINNLLWADPDYNKPNKIDILLGADYYPGIVMNEVMKGATGEPVAQKTELGWIICGPIHNDGPATTQCLITKTELDNRLRAFWEIEEVQTNKLMTKEEQHCQEYYDANHCRDVHGRYEVRIPFKTNPPSLGTSKMRAMARFLQLEKKFAVSPTFADDYKKCIREYITLGHMRICENEMSTTEGYYIPHHAVIKNSATTKLRVVFDASAKTSNNRSLNDEQFVGPTLQEELMSILLRWRKHRIAYTADIEKMYRQIRIHEDDQNYHKILWRENVHEPIQEYKLTTVSFGTASAPYLAIRTLQQLANDEMQQLPIAATITLHDFYVDDILSGGDSIEQTQQQQQQLIKLLSKGGFQLRKWASNSQELLEQIPNECRAIGTMDIKLDESIKTLGISWNPDTDTFGFKINIKVSQSRTITKRQLLSEISQLFDPLGWLSPTIIVAKILLQQLWLTGLKWDDRLPKNIEAKWNKYKHGLPLLEQIRIPRWVNTCTNSHIELHGFCDASEQAYAAAIYIYQRNDINKIAQPLLLVSKTKVAPIKTKLTIPRLELCAALLLARLMTRVIKSLRIHKTTTYMWTDSMIVLTWIRAEPHKYKTFVANRVSEIHSLSNPSAWNYVKSADNPADCASRGVEPDNLGRHQLWWNGPSWLTNTPKNWLIHKVELKPEDVPDKRVVGITTRTTKLKNENPFDILFVKYSNLKKIQRIVSYCKRFINKLKLMKTDSTNTISPQEMQEALHHLIKSAQQVQYRNEIYHLNNNEPIANKSKLLSLTPFLKNDLLRVGGRLHNATAWSYDEKHPIILPQSHPIVDLIIFESHKTTMHGGTQLTLAHIRTKYWIINGRNLVRKHITKCLKCHRFSKTINQQLMGNLPLSRSTSSRPFLRSGIDYAGPFNVRVSKGRGNKSYKGYLAIFVCMATKAVHIEVVSDLTTDAFLAAYKRFTSRRGICTDIFCDNGTNFVGASKIMEVEKVKHMEQMGSNIITSIAEHGTKWHFIPPGAPHFGGLWEAAVKSVKYHLKRVIGESTLTFEELTTVTCRIEACLNSRPISPMTNDPSDPTFLTPGHFLIGEPIITQPEAGTSEKRINLLTRWKLTQRMMEDFWKRWSQEYLHQLQQRAKWTTQAPDLKVGQLVLIRDNNIPPSRWITGRVVEVHPGQDGIVRVATLRGPGRVLIKRPITKLAPLPIADTPKEQCTESVSKVTTVLSTAANSNYKKRHTTKESASLQGKLQENVEGMQKSNYQPQTKRRKIQLCYQSKLMLYSMLSLLSVLGVCSTITKEASYDITSLNTTSGIYFENIGTAQLSHQQWTIVSYFNLSAMMLEIEIYNAAIKRMNKSCNDDKGWMQLRQLCRPAILQMNHQLFNIDVNNEMFQPTYTYARTKRGLVNVVGTLTNQLFGILDQDDAIRYDKEISSIKANEHHLNKLLKEQITITEATVNIIKKDWITVNNQLQEIDKQTTSILNIIQKNEHENIAIQQFMGLWIHLSTEMTTFAATQQQLIDVITDVHHSKINTFILKPDQLKAELQKLHELIPADATIYGENSMISLYQMMTAKVGQVRDILIFELKMPLLNNKIYQIIKPIAIPTMHKDMYTYIRPSSELFLMSLNRESYYPMSEDELSACKSIKPEEYICMIHNVIQNTQINPTPCEISLIMNKQAQIGMCDIRFIKPKNMWIPTHDPSMWIFISKGDHTINIICNKKVSTTTITGTGILKLHQACTITDGMTTLHTIQTFNSRTEVFYQPTISLSSILIQSENETKLNTTNRTVMKHEFDKILTDLNQLSTNISQLKNAPQEEDQLLSIHDVHQYTLLYGIVAALLGLIIAYYCKRKMTTTTSAMETATMIPLPRRFISTNVAPEDVQSHEHLSSG